VLRAHDTRPPCFTIPIPDPQPSSSPHPRRPTRCPRQALVRREPHHNQTPLCFSTPPSTRSLVSPSPLPLRHLRACRWMLMPTKDTTARCGMPSPSASAKIDNLRGNDEAPLAESLSYFSSDAQLRMWLGVAPASPATRTAATHPRAPAASIVFR